MWKKVFLDSLRHMREEEKHLPWILGGDFNLIRNLEEKKGGVRRISPSSDQFNILIDDLGLVDVHPTNNLFTWHNNQLGERSIAYRLDHFLVTEDIVLASGDLSIVVLPLVGLDH